jgi:phenylalanyl-tRNA synthetase beta chain
VEPVEVRYTTSCPALLKGEKVHSYPDMSTRDVETGHKECCSTIGQDIPLDTICNLCSKMMLSGRKGESGDSFIATVPVTRSDILHPVDVIEDVAIAFGYNNLTMTIPPVNTVGKEFPLNHLADLLCDEVARAGYIQMMTLGLCSEEECFTKLGRKDDPARKAVTLSNPATKDFDIVRTSLLPGTLKTLAHNIALPKPIKLFEVTDVVFQDGSTDTGAKNERHAVALYCGNTTGFELIHGLVDLLMRKMEVYPLAKTASLEPMEMKEAFGTYKLVARTGKEDTTFIPGQAADLTIIKKTGERVYIPFSSQY